MKIRMTPVEVKASLRQGVMSFPLTDFDSSDEFNERSFVDRLAWLAPYRPCAVVAAGGAGEFFSLTKNEYAQVVAATVAQRVEGVPVIASAGYGTKMAIEYVEEAERLGADAILLLPPYLTEAPQAGLSAHITAVCAATSLGVIVYNRANCRLSAATVAELAAANANFVGFKDGIGDTEELLKLNADLRERLAIINGMPTAEVYAQAYFGMGITSYSSAILNFLPKSAMAFYRAVAEGDRQAVDDFVSAFLAPYSAIRARQPGYAVSIVKAGVEIIGRCAGPVRSPLTNLTADEFRSLAGLIESQGSQELN